SQYGHNVFRGIRSAGRRDPSLALRVTKRGFGLTHIMLFFCGNRGVNDEGACALLMEEPYQFFLHITPPKLFPKLPRILSGK
ncbi:MAG: hypothetical protein ACXWPG_00340, partial [Ktedonobacteraceae bacterium]